MRFIAVILLSWAVNTSCHAQAKASTIDILINKLAARGQFNGSILVAEHGKLIFEGGFGKADVENNISFSPVTPCYLGSLAKQFTAMAVMILKDQHKLSLSDPLSKYISGFPPYADKITIRHLLNHTSGIPDYVGLGLEHPQLTDTDVLNALIKQESLEFIPGDKFDYSNSNYVLLAIIIEKVSGQKYSSFLKKYIFEPLKMNRTFVFELPMHKKDISRGYSRFGDIYDYDLLTYGEGGIYSTVQDMFKWDQALYTDKLVNQSTLKEIFAPGKLNDGSFSNYGFGWGIGDYYGQTTYSHAGRYGGFNTYIKRFSKDKNTIIFLTNSDYKNMSAIGNAIINVLYEKQYNLPKLSVAEAMNKMYLSGGIESAKQLYKSLRNDNDTSYDLSESELNEFGYHLLGLNKSSDAIEILKLNVEAFPSSWNVYDGLGEAYMKHNDTVLAIKNYKKSLELNPKNSNAASMLKSLNKE